MVNRFLLKVSPHRCVVAMILYYPLVFVCICIVPAFSESYCLDNFNNSNNNSKNSEWKFATNTPTYTTARTQSECSNERTLNRYFIFGCTYEQKAITIATHCRRVLLAWAWVKSATSAYLALQPCAIRKLQQQITFKIQINELYRDLIKQQSVAWFGAFVFLFIVLGYVV